MTTDQQFTEFEPSGVTTDEKMMQRERLSAMAETKTKPCGCSEDERNGELCDYHFTERFGDLNEGGSSLNMIERAVKELRTLVNPEDNTDWIRAGGKCLTPIVQDVTELVYRLKFPQNVTREQVPKLVTGLDFYVLPSPEAQPETVEPGERVNVKTGSAKSALAKFLDGEEF